MGAPSWATALVILGMLGGVGWILEQVGAVVIELVRWVVRRARARRAEA